MYTTNTKQLTAMRRVVYASARAFVSPRMEGGGNPVNIFVSSGPTTSDERVDLAKTCPWESVVIENDTESSNNSGSLPIFHFFMPSGEEVSFCGHAAIGACSFLANKKSIISNKSSTEVASVPFLTAVDGAKYNSRVMGNEVELVMGMQHYETECNPQSCSLKDILSELGLDMSDIPSSDDGISWPTYINSSVARRKTLIPIRTADRLHAATPPLNPTKFREMCDSIDDSTGIYLYSTFTQSEIDGSVAKGSELAFECRQFPRSSGYPEDPATGIAAGALAASLHKRQIIKSRDGIYRMYQGTSMGRPSKIQVKIGGNKSKETNPSLDISYSGLVVFDSLSHSDLK
ncbi:hypothetical protein ACHAXR_005650 [Thalassiosira sp. AJA248-18]